MSDVITNKDMVIPVPSAIAPETTQEQLVLLTQQITALTQRVTNLEAKLLMIPDLERYGRLEQLLREGKFKEADAETTQVILDTVAMKRDELAPEVINKFPCSVLTVIDHLWSTYSEGRFGFSMQLQIYQQGGGTLETLQTQERKIIGNFAREVGWLIEGELQFDVYDQWDFSVNAPKGCFPAIWWRSPYGLKMVTFFFMRLLECRI